MKKKTINQKTTDLSLVLGDIIDHLRSRSGEGLAKRLSGGEVEGLTCVILDEDADYRVDSNSVTVRLFLGDFMIHLRAEVAEDDEP